ncbi:MAG: transposase [Rhodospirillales bacterium]|jgi:putative transposase|nr:transposase [Rhodospirillales bacterium]
MTRLARIVAPGLPHHVTQRGNRRQPTFFGEEDYRFYLDLLAESGARFGLSIWAYCLMPNHLHLIAVPETESSLAQALGEAHRRYTRKINASQGLTGHLWQGRFASFVMDESHLLAAARYIERNPVRAGLVQAPEDWAFSSARAHLKGANDSLALVAPLLALVPDWKNFIAGDSREMNEETVKIRRHISTGRPLGDGAFVTTLENRLGRSLAKKKPGPKKKPPTG